MKEAKRDLFEGIKDPKVDAICITTNGHWSKDGQAAMGGGCAGVCREKWIETTYNLGALLQKNAPANIPFLIGAVDRQGTYFDPATRNKEHCLIFSFPTIDTFIMGADLELIHRSAVIMTQYANAYDLKGILLPRPGVGIGALNWAEVKELIEPVLDNRFTIVSFDFED